MKTNRHTLLITPEITEYYSRRIQLTVQQFPGMPVFVAQLLRDLKQDEKDIRVLSETIRVDPGITTNLLRLANSAAFGAPREITSIREAIVRLGIRRTIEMLVAFHVAGHLSKPLQGYHLNAGELTAHALWTALASEELCRQIEGGPPPDHMFTAALLHDIGKVLLSEFVFQEQVVITGLVKKDGYAFDEAEKKVLGWSHAETGAAILRHWNFPELLVQAAEYHHHPEQAPEPYRLTDGIIHISDFLAYCQGPGAGIDGFSYHFCDTVKATVPLSNAEIEQIAGKTLEQVNRFRSAFGL